MNLQDITTEALIATCMNNPRGNDALMCARELYRRYNGGPVYWTAAVLHRHGVTR